MVNHPHRSKRRPAMPDLAGDQHARHDHERYVHLTQPATPACFPRYTDGPTLCGRCQKPWPQPECKMTLGDLEARKA